MAPPMTRRLSIFERIEADFFQSHFQGEFRGGAGDMGAADFAFKVLWPFDARVGHQIVGQDVDVAGDGDDIAAGEARAGESGAAAFADGNLAGEYRLNAAHAAGYEYHGGVDAIFVEQSGFLGDLDHCR